MIQHKYVIEQFDQQGRPIRKMHFLTPDRQTESSHLAAQSLAIHRILHPSIEEFVLVTRDKNGAISYVNEADDMLELLDKGVTLKLSFE